MQAIVWGRNKLNLHFQCTRGDKGRSIQRKKTTLGIPTPTLCQGETQGS